MKQTADDLESDKSMAKCSICDDIFTGYAPFDLAKHITAHHNQHHGDDLAPDYPVYHAEEYDRYHLHDDEYAVAFREYHVTVYDVIGPENGGLNTEFAVEPFDETLCYDCWRPISDERAAFEVPEADLYEPDHRCRGCHDNYLLERHRENNYEITSFATDA